MSAVTKVLKPCRQFLTLTLACPSAVSILGTHLREDPGCGMRRERKGERQRGGGGGRGGEERL